MNLYQRLCGLAEHHSDKLAIDGESVQLSYRQLLHRVDLCSHWFSQQALGTGDRVAVLALNHPDWFVLLFAAARAGLILVPMNWRLSSDELAYVVTDSQPSLLLHDAEFAGTAAALCSSDDALSCHQIGVPEFLADLTGPPDVGDVALAETSRDVLIVYTSGTTGRPKGAVLSEDALLCSAGMSQHMLDLTAQDRVLNVLPLFHVGGLNIQPLPTLLLGGTLILHARFDPDAAVQALVEQQVTLINTVPTLLQAMLDCDRWQHADLSSLRLVSIGSTDVPMPLIQRVHERGIPLLQVYGATETAPVAIYQRQEHAGVEGSIGRAGILCDVRLADADGNEVALGQRGEIQVRGSNVLSRYWHNPEATEASLHGGWFRTGDVAHQDEYGFYWFDDRLKHVIISGGENIYPAELERVIRELPAVAEVSVVGMADERWGEVPVAVIVRGGSIEAADVFEACTAIARFKRPRQVLFVESLPRNALGKIQVHEVRRQLAEPKNNQGNS